MDDIEGLSAKSIKKTMAALDDLFQAALDLQGVGGIFHINMRVMQNLIYGSAMIIRSLRMPLNALLTEIEEVHGSGHAPRCSEDVLSEDVLFVALLLAALNDTSGQKALDQAYSWYRKITGKNYAEDNINPFGKIGTSMH